MKYSSVDRIMKCCGERNFCEISAGKWLCAVMVHFKQQLDATQSLTVAHPVVHAEIGSRASIAAFALLVVFRRT